MVVAMNLSVRCGMERVQGPTQSDSEDTTYDDNAYEEERGAIYSDDIR